MKKNNKFRIVGELGKEKSFGQKLLLKLEELHPHPILVHFHKLFYRFFTIIVPIRFTGKIPLK